MNTLLFTTIANRIVTALQDKIVFTSTTNTHGDARQLIIEGYTTLPISVTFVRGNLVYVAVGNKNVKELSARLWLTHGKVVPLETRIITYLLSEQLLNEAVRLASEVQHRELSSKVMEDFFEFAQREFPHFEGSGHRTNEGLGKLSADSTRSCRLQVSSTADNPPQFNVRVTLSGLSIEQAKAFLQMNLAGILGDEDAG